MSWEKSRLGRMGKETIVSPERPWFKNRSSNLFRERKAMIERPNRFLLLQSCILVEFFDDCRIQNSVLWKVCKIKNRKYPTKPITD